MTEPMRLTEDTSIPRLHPPGHDRRRHDGGDGAECDVLLHPVPGGREHHLWAGGTSDPRPLPDHLPARSQYVPDSARLDRDPGTHAQRAVLGRIVLHAAEAGSALSSEGFWRCVTQAAKAREIESDVYLPFGRHVTDTVISLSTRALITVIRIDGTSFETAEAADLNDLHAKLNLTLRNIADDRLALWSHLVRRQTSDYPSGTFRSTFSAALDAQYRERLRSEALFRNDLYLTLVWHPGRATTDAAAAFFKRLGRASGRSVEVDSEALKRLDDATRDVVAALERYGARAVGLVDRDGIVFSEAMELLHAVTSGEWMPMPLPQGPIGPALYSNRIIFGREALEIRSAGGSRFAGMFGIKEYPASTRPGLLNALLSAPFELILTQSFAFLSKADAKTVLTRKQNQFVSAQDPAASQIDELSDALDDLESNRFALGDHHLSLLFSRRTRLRSCRVT